MFFQTEFNYAMHFRVSAHRLILSMACDYFAAMFNGSHRESSETEITLHDIPGTALKCLIQFCYTGI